MGLDMYLTRKMYVKNYDHTEKDRRFSGIAFKGATPIDLRRLNYLEFEEIYWRKANAIHRWFVENIQDGNDDCREYYVDKEDLKKLLSACEYVLQDKEKADEVLPTQEGFFFGTYEYDEYYFDDIRDTSYEIKRILDSNDDGTLYYTSSW